MKAPAITIFFLLLATVVFGQDTANETTKTITKSGIGLGSMIAVVTSWDRNKSVFWTVIHGLFSWLYVIYFVLSRDSYDKLNKDKKTNSLIFLKLTMTKIKLIDNNLLGNS